MNVVLDYRTMFPWSNEGLSKREGLTSTGKAKGLLVTLIYPIHPTLPCYTSLLFSLHTITCNESKETILIVCEICVNGSTYLFEAEWNCKERPLSLLANI